MRRYHSRKRLHGHDYFSTRYSSFPQDTVHAITVVMTTRIPRSNLHPTLSCYSLRNSHRSNYSCRSMNGVDQYSSDWSSFPGDPVAFESDWYTLMFLSLELIKERYPFYHVPISNTVAIVRWIQNRTSVFPLQLYSFSIFKYYSSLDTESYIFTSVVGAPSSVLHW